jgi:uncharacterized protein
MYLVDVNILVYAYVTETPDNYRYAEWLENLLSANNKFGMSELVLSGFLRIVTNPKIYDPPSSLEEALAFVDQITDNPNCVRITPGERHWNIFLDLCKKVNARGNLIPDAYLAALAIESGCEWITNDRSFARFPGIKWRHPLD